MQCLIIAKTTGFIQISRKIEYIIHEHFSSTCVEKKCKVENVGAQMTSNNTHPLYPRDSKDYQWRAHFQALQALLMIMMSRVSKPLALLILVGGSRYFHVSRLDGNAQKKGRPCNSVPPVPLGADERSVPYISRKTNEPVEK
jgi:hypothetical protein